ncbi:hypothetical protein N7481_013286 [Penicillium waksmanii]|uniref:uncharacterized protein n=1 Tax=Penicillium waksmanii TaxID=69791 RepID=UPI002547C88E|nr:uncharacterized protein N7481_013286 [Penicillium waksmanii]KAJ5966572.1 hypothetical protein N7481_013286 [Penicillium waksmanii]
MSTTNDNYAIHKVSLKRTRQACGPCRRKKARCPGEKPVCSLCQRLGQHCEYGAQAAIGRTRVRKESTSVGLDIDADEPQEHNGSDAHDTRRLRQIEQRLEEITSMLHDRLPQSNIPTERLSGYLPPTRENIQPDGVTITGPIDHPIAQDGISASDTMASSLIRSEVEVYLSHFHDQPYCVFPKNWLLQNASNLSPEISFPLVALTLRLSVNSPGLFGYNISTGKHCAERAWEILSSHHQNGRTGLSFLQGNFLIAQLDLADGNSHRGCSSVALGLRVIQTLGLNQGKNLSGLSQIEVESRRRITWAYFMLDRTYNASRNYSLCLSDTRFTLDFPSREGERTGFRGSLHEKSIKQGHRVDQGIMACLLRLYSLWGKATEWVFESLPTSSLPPWQSGSALAILESEWMQFETQFADTHRYMNVDFKRRARDQPQSRSYLLTWLSVQFLFHSIPCLLHHPFVTMIKLRHMPGNLSATFLQKSFETSLIHSRWISRFIREMAEVDLRLYDPFFGYLAAIAATIQLEHTGNKNPKIALLLNNEYRDLVAFMTEMSTEWDSMRILVNRLNELAARHQDYGSLFYNQEGFSGALSSMATPSNLPRMSSQDESLMWDILDLTSLGFNKTLEISAMKPRPDNEVSTDENEMSRSSSDEDLEEDVEPLNVPTHKTSRLGEEMSEPADEMPGPEWPFSNQTGNNSIGSGVPDIPDWMIFGDLMTEHL